VHISDVVTRLLRGCFAVKETHYAAGSTLRVGERLGTCSQISGTFGGWVGDCVIRRKFA